MDESECTKNVFTAASPFRSLRKCSGQHFHHCVGWEWWKWALCIFLILEEELSAVHSSLWSWLWTCHVWPFSCCGTCLLHPVCWGCLSHTKKHCILWNAFFFIYCNGHMIFYFVLVMWNVMHHTYWFTHLELVYYFL